MKNVLLTTSALTLVAGAAAADMSVGGSARFGIQYNGTDTILERRMTVNIDGSGETDGGLQFGARLRLRDNEGAHVTTSNAGANAYIGNDMFRLTVGNTDGANVKRVTSWTGTVGLTGLGYGNVGLNAPGHAWAAPTFSSSANGAEVVRLDVNVAGFGISASTSDTSTPNQPAAFNEIAAGYSFGDWNVALGYGEMGATSFVAASVQGSIGDFAVGIEGSDWNDGARRIVLAGGYSMSNGLGIDAFVGQDTTAANVKSENYGLGVSYSLGGGATVKAGLSRNGAASTTVADLGVAFSF